jgi:flagellar biosynthetic protein FliO
MSRALLCALALVLSPAVGRAQGASAAAPSSQVDPLPPTTAPPGIDDSPGAGWLLVRSVLALGGVLGLLLLAGRVLRRSALVRWAGGGTGRVRVLERVPLDARHALVLVQMGGAQFLLGTSDHGVQLLHRLELDDSQISAEPVPPSPPLTGLGFLERLRRKPAVERA